jgi:hypothetical protein
VVWIKVVEMLALTSVHGGAILSCHGKRWYLPAVDHSQTSSGVLASHTKPLERKTPCITFNPRIEQRFGSCQASPIIVMGSSHVGLSCMTCMAKQRV